MSRIRDRAVSVVCVLTLLTFGNISLLAQTPPQTTVCDNNGVIIAFFNGIKNTHDMSDKSMKYLKAFYGETTPSGEKIRYELLYNDTISFFSDVMEVYEQSVAQLERNVRDALIDKYELFFEMLNGDGPWYKKMLLAVPGWAEITATFVLDVNLQLAESIYSLLHNSPDASQLRGA